MLLSLVYFSTAPGSPGSELRDEVDRRGEPDDR